MGDGDGSSQRGANLKLLLHICTLIGLSCPLEYIGMNNSVNYCRMDVNFNLNLLKAKYAFQHGCEIRITCFRSISTHAHDEQLQRL